jgi:hypothetical protein
MNKFKGEIVDNWENYLPEERMRNASLSLMFLKMFTA